MARSWARTRSTWNRRRTHGTHGSRQKRSNRCKHSRRSPDSRLLRRATKTPPCGCTSRKSAYRTHRTCETRQTLLHCTPRSRARALAGQYRSATAWCGLCPSPRTMRFLCASSFKKSRKLPVQKKAREAVKLVSTPDVMTTLLEDRTRTLGPPDYPRREQTPTRPACGPVWWP